MNYAGGDWRIKGLSIVTDGGMEGRNDRVAILTDAVWSDAAIKANGALLVQAPRMHRALLAICEDTAVAAVLSRCLPEVAITIDNILYDIDHP